MVLRLVEQKQEIEYNKPFLRKAVIMNGESKVKIFS